MRAAHYLTVLLVATMAACISPPSTAQTFSGTHNDEYYLFAGDYPHNQSVFWGDNDALTNGITHDDNNWYITALGTTSIGTPNDDWDIKKIPVGQDLVTGAFTLRRERDEYPVLNTLGYNHAGDLDHFHYGTADYLIVPFEKIADRAGPAIAILRCDDLSFVDYAEVPAVTDGIGWCAVSPVDSCLYTSNDDADVIFKYSINWSDVSVGRRLVVTQVGAFPLPGMYHNMQGGEFTPDGKLLYINSGIISACACNPFADRCPCRYKVYPNDGLHALSTGTWQELQHSTSRLTVTDFNCDTGREETIRSGQIGCFDYTFDNSGCSGEEPEGLTVWDLDDGRAPNITGQLHVISYNHNNHVCTPLGCVGDDNLVFLKHYATVKVEAMPNVTKECSGRTTPVEVSAQVDNAGLCGPVSLLWSSPGVVFDDPTASRTIGHFPHSAVGTPAVVTVTASEGPSHSTDTVLVRIVDTTPPVIVSKRDHIVLWPPNHEYRTITADDVIATASDVCDGRPAVTVVAVTSDEPSNGGNDAVIVCPSTVLLRAERDGRRNGRVYTITYAATDASGNQSLAVSHVAVPHDRRGAIRDADSPYVVRGACSTGVGSGRVISVAVSSEGERPSTGQGAGSEEVNELALSIHTDRNPVSLPVEFSCALPVAGLYRLSVFDVVGRRVRTVVHSWQPPGRQTVVWDGRSDGGSVAKAGVYYVRLELGQDRAFAKLVVAH
jgi:hypothetical protein